MRKVTKTLALFLTLIMILGSIASCAGEIEEITEAPSETESESVVEEPTSIETGTVGESAAESATESVTETDSSSTEASGGDTTEEASTTAESEFTRPVDTDTGWETLENIELEEELCSATKGHCVVTNWIPAIGTTLEKRYCYNCHKEMYERATPFTVCAVNMEQTTYQTAIRSDKADGTAKLHTMNSAKIVIPTSADYNTFAANIGVKMTGNYDKTIVGNTVYYSVDGGETWAPCPAEAGVLTIAITSEMFTGDNEGNVEKAKNNGIKYGVIPGYNADYVAEHPEDLASVVCTIVEIEKDVLSTDTADAGGHKDDPALKVDLCEHSGSRTVEETTDGEYSTYTYKCTTCNKVLGTSGKVKAGMTYSNQFWIDSDIVGVQNGVAFTRIQPVAGQKVQVKPMSGNVKLGKYVVIKYRAMGYGSLKATWEYSGNTKSQSIARAETDGWVIAVMNVQSMFGSGIYVEGKKGSFTLTLECEGVVDIAYVAMASDILDLCAIMGENVTFYHRGKDFAKVGSLCDSNTGKCIVHTTKVTITDNADKTAKIYSYVCDACEDKLADDMTVSNTVKYFTNITDISIHALGEGKTSINYLSENGVTFARVEPTGDSSAVAWLPSGTYDLGRYIAIKYRVSGDGSIMFRAILSGSANDNQSKTSSDHTKDTWMVAVMDLSAFQGYQATTSFYSVIYTRYILDIAYIAISDSLEDIRLLLGEDEVYFYRGEGIEAFNNISGQIEVDKNGKCASDCVQVTIPAVAPTCSSAGHTQGSVCCACGKIFVEPEEIPSVPENHVIVEIPAVSATCNSVGYTAGSECSECGKVFVERVELPKDSSEHPFKRVTLTETTGDDYTSYVWKCNACSTIVCERTIKNTLAYVDGNSFTAQNSITAVSSSISGSVPYRSIRKTSYNASFPGYASVTLAGATLGEYVAIKYRVPTAPSDADAQIVFQLNLGGKAVCNYQYLKGHYTGDWVVALIYIGDNANYKSLVAGDATTADMVITIQNNNLDVEFQISYLAMGSFEELSGLLVDGETYMYRGNSFSNVSTQTEVDKNGHCVGAHSAKFTKDTTTTEGKTSYIWKCSVCSEVLSETTVDNTLAYIDGTSLAAGNGQITGYGAKFEDGVGYRHLTSKSELGYCEATITGATLGRYVAVKYRVTDAANDGNVYFQLFHGEYSSIHKGTMTSAQTDGWVVAVIDLANQSQYKALNEAGTTTGLKFILRVANGASVDVAYMVMSDDMNVIRGFLGENETYFNRGEDFGNVPGTEMDKNGKCVGDHVNTNAGDQTTAECEICGETFTVNHAPTEATGKEE